MTIDFSGPWPWYVCGLAIGLLVPLLLLMGNRSFGISGVWRSLCAAVFPSGIPYFRYNWKADRWNLYFAGGIVLGAFAATRFLTAGQAVVEHPALVKELAAYGINDFSSPVPKQLISFPSLLTLRGFILMIGGGFLIGFGSRYAGGCTSGHCITGLSALQWPSAMASLCFAAGGLATSRFLLPLVLQL